MDSDCIIYYEPKVQESRGILIREILISKNSNNTYSHMEIFSNVNTD